MLESEAMAILVGAGVSYGRREAALRAAGSALAILAEPGLYAAQLQEKGLALLRHALADEARLLGGLAKKKMALVLREDAQYPPLLRQIAHPPHLLYVYGETDLTDHFPVAVVGTRRASAYGLTHTREIAAELAQTGVCVVSGLALGIIHVKLKVPSFIASLGFMSLWQSVALLITQNPESVPKALWGTVEWYKIAFGVVGLPLIVAIAIILFIHCVTRYTPSGRTIFAIGGNERTARVAGMGVDRTKILVFAINGVLAALAGIFLAANLRSSAPTIGDPFTLKIVAACALGGTSLAGGKGSELGTILGVFTVAIIENGMNFIGVNAYYQNIVFGIFVLAAIALTVDRSIRGQIVK